MILKYSEQELVAQLKKQDHAAFAYLYDNYAGALNGILLKLVNEVTLAEDLLQESFSAIFLKINMYDETKGRLFTWLARLTKNLAIDTIRSKSFRQKGITDSHEFAALHVIDENICSTRFDSLGVKNKLLFLNVDQKLVLDMAYFYGLTHEQIAQALQIPVGTVKTKIRSAIKELRLMLCDKKIAMPAA